MTMSSSEFLTDLQLAERWHIHRQTLISWRTSGTGPPFVRISNRVLYPLAGVEQYEQANYFTNEDQ